MAINGISSSAAYSANQNSSLTKFKENFEKLGKALETSKISDAKDALTQIQKGFTASNGSGINPVATDIASLGKTLDSGDIKSAQEMFSKIQEKLIQRRPVQTGGNSGGNEASGTTGTSTSGQSQGAYNVSISSQAQTAVQNLSGMFSAVNPAVNHQLGALISAMA